MTANENELTGAQAPQSETSGVATEAVATEAEAPKLQLNVEIQDVGPCRKHVKIGVPRSEVDRYFNEAVRELVTTAAVPGFRTGHVPRKLIEKRFKKEVGDQVKQKLLVDSLDQMAADHELDAINEPDLKVDKIQIPETGDFEYEFDVEVRPDFKLPDYAGLTIERPIGEVSAEEIGEYRERFLSQFGTFEVVEEPAAPGEFVLVDITINFKGDALRRIPNTRLQLKPVLRFHDAELEGFDTLMTGSQPGDTRQGEAVISTESAKVEMRGETVQIEFKVISVERRRLPEIDAEFLSSVGVESEEGLEQAIRGVLQRQVTYAQRQRTREQVLTKITESADWDLPESLVRRQVENALRREILEMQQAGFTNEQIRARENEMRQRSVSTTRQALKEHFVLDKIAREEKLAVSPEDVEIEIEMMAMQSGESPRRVRARLDKQGMLENLEAQILERKAVDVILERAVFKDVPLPRPEPDRIETVDHPASGGDEVPTLSDRSEESGESA